LNRSTYALLVTTTIFGVFGVWSAFNPSWFTIKKFGVTPEDMETIKTGMLMAAAAIVLRMLMAAAAIVLTVIVAFYVTRET
jgi:hypothetical protein